MWAAQWERLGVNSGVTVWVFLGWGKLGRKQINVHYNHYPVRNVGEFSIASLSLPMSNWSIHTADSIFFFFNVLFIFETMQAGEGQREGKRGSKAGSALTAVNPMWDSNSPTVRS